MIVSTFTVIWILARSQNLYPSILTALTILLTYKRDNKQTMRQTRPTKNYRDVTEPAEIRFHRTWISHLTSVIIQMRIYWGNHLQTALTNKSLE